MTNIELVTIKDHTCFLSDGSTYPIPDLTAVEWNDQKEVWLIWSLTSPFSGWIGKQCRHRDLVKMLTQLEIASDV